MAEADAAGSLPEENQQPGQDAAQKPKWQPLNSIDRRVAGVLAEKAKTTPDAYPLSLNAVCTGCNQKSNRSPIMQLEPDVVEESLDRLREMGTVGIVQGYGRVSKYRHYLYDWLGVDKLELAVMTELLLRGDQTEGDLRARAARMEQIAGLPELRPILESLKAKGLVVPLTPEGRGHVVTHALYQPQEMERLKKRYAESGYTGDNGGQTAPAQTAPGLPNQTARQPAAQPCPHVPLAHAAPVGNDAFDKFAREQTELRNLVLELQNEIESVKERLRETQSELQTLKDALGA